MKKLAIIVPYRDRQKELDVFLPHIDSFLKDKNVNYQVIVIEQRDERPFNRGKLFNAAPIRRMEAKFKTLDMISEGPLMIDCFILFADFDIGDENEEILLVLLILSLSSFCIFFLLSDNDLN